jgi:hypothetical protein
LLTSPSTLAERQDLDFYRSSVRAAAGEMSGWAEEVAPDTAASYMAYVQGTWGPSMDGMAGKFSYEKWVGSAQRRVTEDGVN